MDIVKELAGMDPALKTAIEETCDRLAKGIPSTRDEKLRAIAAMNRMREEIRRRTGVESVAVDLVRQSRDGK